ncbi:uncharacterized protein VP01_5343g2, partial [Puccinia sorghi]
IFPHILPYSLMSQSNSSAQAYDLPKFLTPHQQQWLDGVIGSMKKMINTQFAPVNDLRTLLQNALADDDHLTNIDIYYNSDSHKTSYMLLDKGQFPDFYSLWVARRADLRRGLSIFHKTTSAHFSDLWFKCRPL